MSFSIGHVKILITIVTIFVLFGFCIQKLSIHIENAIIVIMISKAINYDYAWKNEI